MDVVEKLLCLDSTLRYLAAERTDAGNADDVSVAAIIDVRWQEFDQKRQTLIATASDAELIAYELERHDLAEFIEWSRHFS